jgi:hypothetical protein
MRARFVWPVLLAALAAGCGHQVCECAVYVGGTTPASEGEQHRRGQAVSDCLAKHGGGTIQGCPMPASLPRPSER